MFEDEMPEVVETRAEYIDIAEHERLAGMPADALAGLGADCADGNKTADAM